MLVEQHLRKQEARCGFGRAGPRVVGNTEGRSCCRAVGEGQPVAGPRADGRRVPACDALLPGGRRPLSERGAGQTSLTRTQLCEERGRPGQPWDRLAVREGFRIV